MLQGDIKTGVASSTYPILYRQMTLRYRIGDEAAVFGTVDIQLCRRLRVLANHSCFPAINKEPMQLFGSDLIAENIEIIPSYRYGC